MLTDRDPAVAGGVPAPDRRLSRRLLLASGAAVVLAAVCYLLMVRTGLGQRFDEAAYLGARKQSLAVRVVDRSVLRRITGDSLALVLVVLIVLGLWRRRIILGVSAAAAAGLTVVLTDFLKSHLLIRPNFTQELNGAINSYPSGHTAAAVVCAMALVLVASPRWRGLAAVVAGAYGWITAAQVQTAGWHRPSDAIGGSLLAFAAVTAVAGLMARYKPVGWRPGQTRWLAYGALGLVALWATAASAKGLLHVLAYLRTHGFDTVALRPIRGQAYATGVAITVDVVVFLLIALLLLLSRSDLDEPVSA